MTKTEQMIVNYRFILQRITIDKYEESALLRFEHDLEVLSRQLKQTINAKTVVGVAARVDARVLLKEVNAMLKDFSKMLATKAAPIIGEAGEFSYADTNAIMSWDGRVVGYNPVSMSSRQIAAMTLTEDIGGKNLGEWLYVALSANSDELANEIQTMRKAGLGYKSMMKELATRYEQIVDDSKAKQHFETTVKSYIQAANAKAHRDIYKANADLIDEVEWSAIMENGNAATGRGTCPRCMALDGKTWPTVADGPPCPLHPRCRCMYLPVVKSWKELFGVDIAESDTGNLIYERDLETRKRVYGANLPGFAERTDKTYAQWWATKPYPWQVKAIGRTRTDLVRGHKVAFGDLVDDNGDLIPIKELI